MVITISYLFSIGFISNLTYIAYYIDENDELLINVNTMGVIKGM